MENKINEKNIKNTEISDKSEYSNLNVRSSQDIQSNVLDEIMKYKNLQRNYIVKPRADSNVMSVEGSVRTDNVNSLQVEFSEPDITNDHKWLDEENNLSFQNSSNLSNNNNNNNNNNNSHLKNKQENEK